LFDTSDEGNPLQRILQAFAYRAIATLTLELESDWQPPQPMLMLDEDLARSHVGQWVFKRAGQPRQLSVVISDATDFLKQDRAPFVQAVATQIREQCARHPLSTSEMPAVKHQRLIVEKRATFDAVPGLARPTNKSPWPRIVLAGDWTDTGYPAVLEGAVRSGLAATAILEKELSLSGYAR
jgi:predicted NAD/FAD-dependent oxidoreductase